MARSLPWGPSKRKRHFCLAAALTVAPSLAAQTKYADPDSPAVQAAARAALPHAKILDIVGITNGIQSQHQDL
jgi:hypothetical protein